MQLSSYMQINLRLLATIFSPLSINEQIQLQTNIYCFHTLQSSEQSNEYDTGLIIAPEESTRSLWFNKIRYNQAGRHNTIRKFFHLHHAFIAAFYIFTSTLWFTQQAIKLFKTKLKSPFDNVFIFKLSNGVLTLFASQ